jgi:hypothetical protein
MVDPEREPLSGVVEADETIIPFRTKNDPIVVPAGRSAVGKMLVAGAAACGRQTSVTAGTIMHATKLPLTTWFWAAFLTATHSNGISALQLQSQLGLGSYPTAWMLCAKLRRAMVDPDRQPLCGLIEADEMIIPFRTKNDPIVVPAGRSGVGKNAGRRGSRSRRRHTAARPLKVIEGFGQTEIRAFVLGAVAPATQAGDRRLAVLSQHPRDQAQGDHRRPNSGSHRAALGPPPVLKSQALGTGGLP